MVTVTERAATELQEVLKNQNVSETEGIKLAPGADGRIQMVIGQAEAGDQVMQRDGHPLLIVAASIVDVLDGTEVDFQSGDQNGTGSGGFTLKPIEGAR